MRPLAEFDTRFHDIDVHRRDRDRIGIILERSTRCRLVDNAGREDAGIQDIHDSIDLLRRRGWLKAALPTEEGGCGLGTGGPAGRSSVRAFVDLARANLSVARLFEGHVNAIHLLDLYAHDELRARAFEVVRTGGLLGVWGADAEPPVALDLHSGILRGKKRYASGLGVVAQAVISVDADDAVRLCLADASDATRQDRAAWAMNGMRASASGEYDFDGLEADTFEMFGAPGDYYREPGFVGGVWRIAAIQLGGTFGLLEAGRTRLHRIGRLDAAPQIARLAGSLQNALGAIGLVERAAEVAGGTEGKTDPERSVALSMFARLQTEEIGQSAISSLERSIGLEHFAETSPTGRIARDLSVYLRQVARDAFLTRAGATGLNVDREIVDLWYG